MHILYVDMSGSLQNKQDRHFIMAGVAVKETAIYHVIRELDTIIADSDLSLPHDIELHGVDILRGKKFWRSVPPDKRVAFFHQCLSIFHGASRRNLRCFGIIIEKGSVDGNVAEHCYEQICSRFNQYLQRLFVSSRKHSRGYKHRGLLVVDDSKYEGLFQNLAAEYRVNGTKWGQLQNLAEVPLFTSSEASRLVQLSDLVSYSLWQKFERGDNQYFRKFVSAFDYADGRFHGIYHRRDTATQCDCPGCATR